jgi:hypothetical protein
MKIEYADKSFIALKDSATGNIFLSVGAKSPDNTLSLIVNTVELTPEQIKNIINFLNKKEGS